MLPQRAQPAPEQVGGWFGAQPVQVGRWAGGWVPSQPELEPESCILAPPLTSLIKPRPPSPVPQRSVPPLRPEWVYALKTDFPHLQFSLNGGVQGVHEAKAAMDSVPAWARSWEEQGRGQGPATTMAADELPASSQANHGVSCSSSIMAVDKGLHEGSRAAGEVSEGGGARWVPKWGRRGGGGVVPDSWLDGGQTREDVRVPP